MPGGWESHQRWRISHFPVACFCCMSKVWYNFSLSKSYKDQNKCICLCAFAILTDFRQRVEEELKMQCQNFDKQGLSAMGAVGKNETKNLGLDFNPSLIWQQCVASGEAEQRLESTTWPGWHLFTRASSQLLWELTVSYGNQRAVLIKRHFSTLQNYLSRPGYSLGPLPTGTFGCHTFPHTPHSWQLADCCCCFSSIKGFPNKNQWDDFKERWRVKYYFFFLLFFLSFKLVSDHLWRQDIRNLAHPIYHNILIPSTEGTKYWHKPRNDQQNAVVAWNTKILLTGTAS